MKNTLLAIPALLFVAPLAAADGPWRTQAKLLVPGTGLTEAVLPAGLHFRGSDGFDLALDDETGQPVPFELYWREGASGGAGADPGRGWAELAPVEKTKGVYRLPLPGVGLAATRLRLRGTAPYTGAWTLSALSARRGERVLAKGQVHGLGRKPLLLDLGLNGDLQAAALQLALEPPAAKAFALAQASLETRLPRLVFLSTHAGQYRLRTGLGQRVQALEAANEDKRPIAQRASAGPVERNAAWNPQALLADSPLYGAAFHDEGYAWSAPVSVRGAGSYRLALNQAAALDPGYASLRLVQGGLQVPYVWSQDPQPALAPLALKESYDAKRNESSYTLLLPQASARWKTLRLQAHGAFKRLVILEQPKESGAYEVWQQRSWVQRAKPEPLEFSLEGLRPGVVELHVTVAHGSGQRLPLDKAEAGYDAPALLFVAGKASHLRLFGGNPDAVAPDYDLGFFDELLGLEDPAPATLGALKPYAGQSWWQRLKERADQKAQLGLYLALGLVTVGLLVLIVKVLPKAGV